MSAPTLDWPTVDQLADGEFKAGVYADMSPAEYHADPVPGGSLSSTGARQLSGVKRCPARFHYDRTHEQKNKAVFDIGTAVHTEVLGTGEKIHEVKSDTWRTKDARLERDAAYERGDVPLLTAVYDRVKAMAQAVREHPVASALFDPKLGSPEQSLFWRDRETEVWCRARLDQLRDNATGVFWIPDLKTCEAADDESIAKSIATYGYHQQGDFYRRGVIELGIDQDPVFGLVFIEKEPPHLIRVVRLDKNALDIGHLENSNALWAYRECRAAGQWPGYGDHDEYGIPQIATISLPPWLENKYK